MAAPSDLRESILRVMQESSAAVLSGTSILKLDGLEAGTEVLLHPPDSVKDVGRIQKRGT